MHKALNPKSDTSNTEKMLIQLLDRLADTKFASKAESCFYSLLKSDQYDGTFLVNFLLKNSSYVNKNLSTSFKHQIPRLLILNTLITEFPLYENDLKKLSQQTFPFAGLITKVKEGADASNPEHRKISLQVIVSLYSQFGFKKVETLIGEMPLKHLEVLAKDIPEAEAYAKAKKHNPTTKKE
jgi:hypothetical protein